MALSGYEKQKRYRAKHPERVAQQRRAYRARQRGYERLPFCEKCLRPAKSSRNSGLVIHHTFFQTCMECMRNEGKIATCIREGHRMTLCRKCHLQIHSQAEGRERAMLRREVEGMDRAFREKVEDE